MLPVDRRRFLHLLAGSVGALPAGLSRAGDLPGSGLPKIPSVKPRPIANSGNAVSIIIGRRTDDIQGLDPHEAVAASAVEIIGNVYETLFTYDAAGKIKPLLAESHTSRDQKKWIFTIVKKHRFSSGNELTAADVAFSLQRLVKMKSSASEVLRPLRLDAATVNAAITVEQKALVIQLPRAIAPQLLQHCLAATACSVVDKVTVESKISPLPDGKEDDQGANWRNDQGEQWLRYNSAGSGPFSFSNAENASEITLTANCRDPEKRSPTPVVIQHVAGSREQRQLLKTGAIHVARNLLVYRPPATTKKLPTAKRGPPEATSSPLIAKANLLVLCMNTAVKGSRGLEKTEMRAAIRRAINVDELAGALNSPRWRAQNHFIPSVLGDIRETAVAPAPKDDSKDEKLPEGTKLTIAYIAGNPRARVVQLLARQLAAINVTLTPNPKDARRFIHDLPRRDHDLVLLSWNADYLDPHSNAHAFCTNSATENNDPNSPLRTLAWLCSWHDDKAATLVNDAAGKIDEAGRKQCYVDIDKHLRASGPYVFLLEEVDYYSTMPATPSRPGYPLALGALDGMTRFPCVADSRTTQACDAIRKEQDARRARLSLSPQGDEAKSVTTNAGAPKP